MKKPKSNPQGYDKTFGATNTPEPQVYFKEHQKLKSRLGGKSREISCAPVGGGMVTSRLACLRGTDDITKQ
jgi:hypothetical protein